MKSNISQYIPYNCISANLLENYAYPGLPFFRGTGFFVYFPPFDDYIFYVSAKHCFCGYKENEFLEKLKIPYQYKTEENFDNSLDEAVIFSEYLMMKHNEDDDDYEDLIVFVVDKNISKEKKLLLKRRALRLEHQDTIDKILKKLCKIQGNIRTVGFPQVSKEIDFDIKQARIQARGFYGKISIKKNDINRYKFNQPSWKEGEYNGFSGSPILEIMPFYNSNYEIVMEAIPIGILLSATKHHCEFISINVATNLIAEYLYDNQSLRRDI
jgi:hypothetical protein